MQPPPAIHGEPRHSKRLQSLHRRSVEQLLARADDALLAAKARPSGWFSPEGVAFRGVVNELLQRRVFTAEMVEPGTGQLIRTAIEVRIDPLTGHSSRIVPERGLMPVGDFDLDAFAGKTRPRCPFCPERIFDADADVGAGNRSWRADHLRRGGPVSEPARVLVA